jgi:hypothetical protein
MVNPILIVKFPNTYSPEVGEEIRNGLNRNEDLVNDYHIFCLPNNTDEFEFKVFNGEYTETEYQKLEELINELKK